jgi:hypothetical protein
MKHWSFAREARWMMWLGLIAPAIVLTLGIIVPWLRRAFAGV